jgi:putative heme-binding domain-containing protein
MKAIKFEQNSPGKRIIVLISFALISVLFSASFTDSNRFVGSKFIQTDTTISVYGPYKVVKLPITKGVKIANPIQLKLGPEGVLYAANQTGEIYSLRDTDQDGLEDMALLYCNIKDFGLRSPSGFTYHGDTVYVGTAQQIRAFVDTNKDGEADKSWVVFDKIPNSEHPYEWTTGLSFGPDGWLYFGLSTDSWNAAPSPDPTGYRGSILRVSPDGKKVERVVTGIRSVYGMGFNQYGDLFFTDNEGGGNPTEELNRVVKNGFYGHNPTKYAAESTSIIAPVHTLETEVAPSGIEFNRIDNDFGGTAGNLFIAFYGPGERWTRGGVGRIEMKRAADGSYTYKEFPVADIPKLSNLAFGNDGSLYVANHGKADYWYNAVYENQGNFYKLVYDPTLASAAVKTREKPSRTFSKNSIEAGRQLFAERACLGCHSTDGTTELLGPNLKDVGKRLTREEIQDEILKPSERIKPSMMAVRVTKKDGTVLIGRVVNSDQTQIALMLVGNHVVKIARKEIVRSENDPKSLMYEGLLNPLTTAQREALLDYIVSLSN